jgi:hypothetical protein
MMDAQLPIQRVEMTIRNLQVKKINLDTRIEVIRSHKSGGNGDFASTIAKSFSPLLIFPLTIFFMVLTQVIAFSAETGKSQLPYLGFIFDAIVSINDAIVNLVNSVAGRAAGLILVGLMIVIVLFWDVFKVLPFQVFSLGLSLVIAIQKFRMQRLQNRLN